MRNFLTKKNLLLSVALVVSSIGTANAALPAEVVTALADAASDVATLGGNVLIVFVAIAAFKYLRKGF